MPAELLLTARKFRVERRPYVINGRPHPLEVIVHPGAAVVLPILDDGRIVLIRNRRPVLDGEALLEVPAGTLDDGEEPLICARRELAEETGYRAERLTLLTSFYSSPGIMTERMHVFLATGLTPGPTALEPGEEIAVEATPLADALAAVREGRIQDGKTIITLLYYACFRRDGEATGADR
ncbi:MAG: NUDIX hydrolase [Phycisphaerales bacterium]|nr:NUDIX hydrolase [Phycisphaerales bacterium]